MKNIIVIIARIALSIWKPDFRKTVGWLFITVGMAALAPPFVHETILYLLGLIDLELVNQVDKADTVGALLVCIGILFHLFYMADKPELKTVETVLGLLLIFCAVLLVLFTL